MGGVGETAILTGAVALRIVGQALQKFPSVFRKALRGDYSPAQPPEPTRIAPPAPALKR